MVADRLMTRVRKKIAFGLLVIAVTVATAAYLRPVPEVAGQAYSSTIPAGKELALPWPGYGQAALGASGYGILSTHGEQKAVPIASVAKIITALAVLERKPLAASDSGPTITLTAADVQLFEDYYIRGGSVVRVQNGEKINQYQALQAMLLPSGNNIADSLAVWAFGSVPGYVKYANEMLRQMGLTATEVTDASGFSPESVSNAKELVRLGERTLSNPVLAGIVSQQSAVVPVAGALNNVNWLLGQEGVIGIKTGNTDEAGGCFLFAANRTVDNQKVKLIGAILGAPTRDTAISDSRELLRSTDSGFEKKVLIKAGDPVGQYRAPWGTSTLVVAKNNLEALIWRESPAELDARLISLQPDSEKNTEVGNVTVTVGSQEVSQKAVLAQSLPGPSWYWRIFR